MLGEALDVLYLICKADISSVSSKVQSLFPILPHPPSPVLSGFVPHPFEVSLNHETGCI